MLHGSLLSPILANRRPIGWQISLPMGENLSIEREKANEDKIILFKTNSSRDYQFSGNDNPTGIAVKSITISGRCRFTITVPK
ncbi:hypothetical protein PCC7424_4080 [Gloeothece citriformis PCC 7424]|uniref:Uncharacterized protein n=1 Tax=Gloeothece citriformis (strain PCC 7424) TaxID=65393 RepID=B7KL81_GLOC7|nr:hypothetical protein [Gloeothece citriformis]ACK72453.1 hypothetical protein PCC7424_4080 [Gloeothece citriformis PCC 7424]